MGKKWRACMPKNKPEDGFSNIVFSVVNSKGRRIEIAGALLDADTAELINSIIEKQKKAADKSKKKIDDIHIAVYRVMQIHLKGNWK